MTRFLEFLKALVPSIETQSDRNQAYLAEAVDIYDLERRMAEVDRQGLGLPTFSRHASWSH